MRAKFKLTEKTETLNGGHVNFEPVTSNSKENEEFFKWTPWGTIKIGTINEKALATMEVGKDYYVDFTKAD